MFASRINQENAIHGQQTAAAAKNQGLKGLAPKTPAGKPTKTPFETRRNDENVSNLTFGKANGKHEGLDRNAFVTPAGPRTRAPLGNKTANAKILRTPAPLVIPGKPVSVQPTSPRLRRPKIKVHEAAPAEAENILESEEDDIEYMPPRGVPLPDDPDDIWPHDREYPQFQGHNLTRGWFAEYRAQEDGEKDEDALSDIEEKCRKIEGARQNQKAKSGSVSTKRTSLRAAPTTLKAQTAALALANRPSSHAATIDAVTAPKSTRPTSASTVSRLASAAPGNPRFNAAKAASKNTIGYSKGRTVSSFTRKPLSHIHDRPKPRREPVPDSRTSLDDLLKLDSLDMGSDDDDGVPLPSSHRLDSLLDADDELEDFQLAPVDNA